ncbi:MAG: hypothetical protein ACP5VN_07590 [Acidobacteriota bacterium]
MGRRGNPTLKGLLLWPERPGPRCGAPLRRVRRSTAERLAGLWVPSQKFRCTAPACGWEGLWKAERSPFSRPSRRLRRAAALFLGALLALGAFWLARFLSEHL